jgi:crescentin
MTKFAVLFGRADRGPLTPIDKPELHLPSPPSAEPSFSTLAAQMGGDNETLRNLLTDAERRIHELDAVKQAFGRIVEPVSRTIRALEEEKSLAFSLTESLNEARGAHQAVQREAHQLKQQIATLEADKDELTGTVAHLRETAGHLEGEWEALTAQANAGALHIKELEHQLGRATEDVALLREQNRALADEVQKADRRLAATEADRAATAERLLLVQDETRSLQASLEQQVSEASHVSRRLAEAERALEEARGRIVESETLLAAANDEGGKLRAVLHDAQERHRTETNLLNTRLDAVQSRADIAERLLVDARQTVSTLSEDIRTHERTAAQAVAACQAAEKGQTQMRAAQEAQERQIRDLEASRGTIEERLSAATKMLGTRENELAQALHRIEAMTDRLGRLEARAEADQTAYEQRIETLTAELHRERMDKAVLDGALDAARKEQARLLGTARPAAAEAAAADTIPSMPPAADAPRRGAKKTNGTVRSSAA